MTIYDLLCYSGEKPLPPLTGQWQPVSGFAAAGSSPSAEFFAKKYEKAFSDKTEPEEFGIAIGKNNAKLQEAINKALEQMDKDGFLKDTADYWFSSQE